MNQDLIINSEYHQPVISGGGGLNFDYGHKMTMDCEMNIIHELDSSQNANASSSSANLKETAAGAKIKRSKSLDNLLLKTAQDLNRNSSTLEFPSMLSQFRDLQFNE